MRIVLIFIILVFSFGCATTQPDFELLEVSPELQRHGYEYYPPLFYDLWFLEVKQCLNYLEYEYDKDLEYNDITYYIADVSYIHNRFVGLSFFYPRRIYITLVHIFRKDTLQHEMIHMLLNKPGHPEPPFNFCAPRYIY